MTTTAEHDGIHTRALGAYVPASRTVLLPDDLVAWMKLVTLDAIGCGMLGSDLEWTRRVRETVLATEGSGSARVWGSGDGVSAAHAAMINGSAVQGFELDDVGPGSHFGSVTVPVALALADSLGDEGVVVSGDDLLRSVLAGVEVGARVSDSVGTVPHVVCGFHGPGLFGAFGAVATASYVLGLDPEQTVHAISNVAQFTGGLMGNHHAGMGKRLLAGKAAHSGVMAAQLARHGFTNVDNIFECGYGSFPEAFSGARTDKIHLEKLSADLGEDFRAYLIKFKFWAARGPIHPSLECIVQMRRERDFAAADVERIDIALPEASFKAVGWPYQPTSATSAQMNLQYCLAMMLLEGEVFVDEFEPDRLADPAVLDLVSRIHVTLDVTLGVDSPSPKPRDTDMTVTLRDGSTLHHRQNSYLLAFGDDPQAAERVIAKFRRCADGRLTEAEQDRVIELCTSLEKVPDVREITAVLAGADR